MNCPTSSTFVLYLGSKNNDRHWFEQEAASVVDCGVLGVGMLSRNGGT